MKKITIIILISLVILITGCGKNKRDLSEKKDTRNQALTATNIISTQDGGTVSLGRANVKIPPQALSQNSEITIRVANRRPKLESNSNIRYLGSPYEITSPFPLKNEVTITLPFSQVKGEKNISDGRLFIGVWKESRWVNLGGKVNPEKNTISAITGHFSLFAVLGDLRDSLESYISSLSSRDVEVSNLDQLILDDLANLKQYDEMTILKSKLTIVPQWVKNSVLAVEILDFLNDEIFNSFWEVLKLTLERIIQDNLAALQVSGLLSTIIAGKGISLYSGGLSTTGIISGKTILTLGAGSGGIVAVAPIAGFILLKTGDILETQIPDAFRDIWMLNPLDITFDTPLLIIGVCIQAKKTTENQLFITSGTKFYYLNTIEKKWQPFSEALTTVGIKTKVKTKDESKSYILFSAKKGGNTDLFSVSRDDKHIKRLTSHNSDDINPIPSPDNKYIAFESNRSGKKEVYIMESNGTGIRCLTNAPPAHSPDWISWTELDSWIPNSSSIMFRYCNGKKETDWVSCENHVFNLKDMTIKPISKLMPIPERTFDARESYLSGDICWSPNGEKAIFVGFQSEVCELWLTGIDHKKSIALHKTGSRPLWFPDNRTLLSQYLYHEIQRTHTNFCLINIDARGKSPFVIKGVGELEQIFDYAISPNGKQIAMVVGEWNLRNLWVTDNSDRIPRQITDSASRISALEWSPDGKYLAFQSEENNSQSSIFIIRPNGTDLTRIIGPDSGHIIGSSFKWTKTIK